MRAHINTQVSRLGGHLSSFESIVLFTHESRELLPKALIGKAIGIVPAGNRADIGCLKETNCLDNRFSGLLMEEHRRWVVRCLLIKCECRLLTVN